MSATAPSGRAAFGDGSSTVVPMPLSPWTSVARTTDPSSAPGRTLRHRDVVPAVGVEEPQRVLGAARDVGVAAHRGDGEQVDLRAGRREADGQRIVQARVAVDDQRQRALGASRTVPSAPLPRPCGRWGPRGPVPSPPR